MRLRFPIYNRQKNSLINKRSQSALEYMMTYGWAILIIVIVAAVLYSFGIFSPSSSISATITGFSGLGSVQAECLGNTSFTVLIGDSTGYSINITKINLTSSSGSTTYNPNVLIQPNSVRIVTVPSSSLCTAGSRYSVSAVIAYTEPGQTFQGPYFSSGTVSGTAASPPSSITSYEPLTITNSQNQGTPSSFQQMVNVTSSDPGWTSISSSLFGQNVEFFSPTGQILDSWLENYTSTHAIWWVKLPTSIPPGSSQAIYMGFAPASTNLFNTVNIGEAPQLSSTYAEYDDGSNVFPIYFNGNTPISDFTVGSGFSLTQATGVSFGSATINAIHSTGDGSFPTFAWAYNKGVSNNPYVLEAVMQHIDTDADVATIGFLDSSSSPANAESVYMGYASSFFALTYKSAGTYIQVVNQQGSENSNWNYYTVIYYGSSASSYYSSIVPQLYSTTNGYYGTSSVNPLSSASSLYVGDDWGNSASTPNNYYINWLRTRAYPPNGVMSSVSFGSVS